MSLISNWLPPLSSHTHSVASLFFPTHSVASFFLTPSVVSLSFSHTFSCLHFFLTHIQLPPLFSHTHSVVSLLFPTSYTHSVVSTVSHTFGCLPLFSHTCSVACPFFSHFHLSPFFLTHIPFPPLFSHTCSVPSLLFSHLPHTFSCLHFFLTHL